MPDELIELDDGVFVNSETGEISEIPEGLDRCSYLAQVCADALAQVKAWEIRAVIAKAGLLRYQTEPRAAYGEVVVRIQQSTRRTVDAAILARRLDETEAPRDVLLYLLAASRVPVDAVGPALPEAITETMTKPFVVLDRVRRRAPGS